MIGADASRVAGERASGGWFTRGLLMLANSRELTLFLLIAILALVMTVFYPRNFPTSSNMAAVLLNAAQNGILVTGMMLLMIGRGV